MAASTIHINLVLCSLLLPFLLHCCNSSEVENETAFSYLEGSNLGPDRWGELHPQWRACRDGKIQSPIDVVKVRVNLVSEGGGLNEKYKAATAVTKNRGHDINLRWNGDAGSFVINGTKYYLKQLHWHSPSEHKINGTSHDMELHMVHSSRKGETAVVGILYKLGTPDPFLAKLMAAITLVGPTEKDVGIIDPRDIKFGSSKYYRYIGSLTTPPCTEGIIWSVIGEVNTVSKEPVHALRQAVNDGCETNARSVQNINDREVFMYRATDKSKAKRI